MNLNKLSQSLKNRFQEPLPGIEAQKKMWSRRRDLSQLENYDASTVRRAGVLLMLYPHQNTIYTALMRRPESPYAHSGQISFPGGREENSDGGNLIQTALREANEEFGFDTSMVDVVGQLTDMYVSVSDIAVSPTVGVLKERPVFYPDPVEVAEIIEVPLSHLIDEGNHKRKKIMSGRGFSLEVPYYDVFGHVLWGATAMMMSEFLEVYQSIDIH